ncbi:DNA-binding protein HU [Methylophilaceae bacterium]|nr:DNA-binding protein HU [Methylophilaceae bacterium]
MNKGELIEAVAKAAGSTKADAGRAIDATLAAITKALKKGDVVTLIGFGTFKVSKRAARVGRTHKLVKNLKYQHVRLQRSKQVLHLKRQLTKLRISYSFKSAWV